MPKVTYVAADGASSTIDADDDINVMKAAVINGVDGIIGECGGNLMCATCHVYVDSQWVDKVGQVDEGEEEMLEEAAAAVTSESRLSCQIVCRPDLDGLVVRLPESQI